MNTYLLALIAAVAVMAVGFVFYGVLFKEALKDAASAPTQAHLASAIIGIYVLSYFFIQLYSHTSFTDVTGVVKGLYLGLMVGVPFFAVPLFVDSPFFQAKGQAVYAVLFNWVVSFMVLGLVVGYLF